MCSQPYKNSIKILFINISFIWGPNEFVNNLMVNPRQYVVRQDFLLLSNLLSDQLKRNRTV